MTERVPRGTRRYAIEGEIGRGGMGVVYRARDTKLDRPVAIKVLPREVARDSVRLKRLDEEARTLASLNHPNIATIYTLEEAGTVHFLVLELVAGETLSSRLSKGPLPLAEALSVGAQIAAALEAAHERRIVHRDLNPANVMLTPSGRVKVLDFGLAKRTLSVATESQTQRRRVVAGTAGYMSPEQALGKDVDLRTDIWSLACVLYAALTGYKAFGGPSRRHKLRATLERDPDWEALENTGAPSDVAGLLRRCLEKDPASRLGDVRDARLILEKVLAQLPHPQGTPGYAPQPKHNLPALVDRYVERAHEMDEVRELSRKSRLLTLTGVGGCGKTHLCLRLARQLAEDFVDGAWLVELASLTDPELVAREVASTLGLREEAGCTPLELLANHLRGRSLLLVLDNCEHLLEACVELADALLPACPRLRILATSREGLGIAGERTFRVPSLTLPDPKQLPPLEELFDYEAVELFVERACSGPADFSLSEANVSSVVEICKRLDGIPLALELAAARVKVLSVEQIAGRLGDAFRLLTGGSKTALSRHQTLRATLDWSYDLLSEPERALLRRLSVFAGGWTLEAAETVCSGPGFEQDDVLDLLTRLVEKSLVAVHKGGGAARYLFLETVRQYARERLLEAAESEELRERHRDCFLQQAEAGQAALEGPGQAGWLARLETEHDNLRAALEWCLATEGGREVGLRLAMALLRFWEMRGHLDEGRSRLREALAHAEGTDAVRLRAKGSEAAGVLAERQGDYPEARSLLEQSLVLFRKLEDKQGICACLISLGNVARDQGELDEARSMYESSLALARELELRRGEAISLGNLGIIAQHEGDLESARSLFECSLSLAREMGDKQGIARSLNNLGMVVRDQGDASAARAMYEESLALKRELGDRRGIAHTLGNLGRVALLEGDHESARGCYLQCLELFRELGFRPGVAWVLEGLAGLAGRQGDARRGALLFGAAEALREAIGAPRRPDEVRECERELAQVRLVLGEEGLRGAWEEGCAMPLDEALELVSQAVSSESES